MGRTKCRSKRGFIGGLKKKQMRRNKHTVLSGSQIRVATGEQERPTNDIPDDTTVESSCTISASSRKLSVFGITLKQDDLKVEQDDSSSAYFFAEEDSMSCLIRDLLCPVCKNPGVQFSVSKENNYGFSSRAELLCKFCEKSLASKFLTKRLGDSNSPNTPFDINIRATMAFRGIGCGHSAIKEWCSIMNMNNGLSQDAYQNAHRKIHEGSKETFNKILEKSKEAIKKAYADAGVYPNEDGLLNIGVSFDGSWQKRGFSSHNGIGAVIDLLTGLPIDYEVLSNYCQKCTLAVTEEMDDEWVEKHRRSCPKNFTGSAGAMEMESAIRIWQRSVEKHKFRYTTILSDGDSKSYDALCKLNVYGPEIKIQKEDCVNHVSKRMGAALRNLVSTSKAQHEPISGKGKLTNDLMTKIQNYYGRAIKDCSGNVPLMKKRIMAILFHLSSTDGLPKNVHCPPGERSWCFWQRALAKDERPGSHNSHETLPVDIGRKLVPIFERLANISLLERCSSNKTQNPNESLHNVIWRICPKATFVGKMTLETAVLFALCRFSMGASFKSMLCNVIGLHPSKKLEITAIEQDVARLKRSEKALTKSAKIQRKKLKFKKSKKEQKEKKNEGPTYVPGGFDTSNVEVSNVKVKNTN